MDVVRATKKPPLSEEKKILLQAKERFLRCEEAEAEFRKKFVEDLRFANGDPDNHFQWPDQVYQGRDNDGRPCLTINKVRQHNLQIINDAKQNKPSVKTLPIDGKADIKIAKIFDGIVKHIEYNSHAEIVYDTATEFAVQGGLGYWRVVTEYAHDETFEQEIYLRRVKDPLTVYLDCDIQSADGADAKYGFVFEDLTKDEFKAKYPGEKAESVVFPTDRGDDWLGKDNIRICEYLTKKTKKDTLVNHPVKGPMMMSDVTDPEEAKALTEDPDVKKREVSEPMIMWYMLAGDTIIDSKPWAGRYIPIVRVIGEEITINGKTHRSGHTRSMKDAQRMYNYMSSANVEYIALQTKTPFVAPVEAIDGYEVEWAQANKDNLSYLPYNSLREDGSEIPRPSREAPPTGASAYLQGMQTAQQELMMASGQYQEQFGQQSNAQAGVAIQARQRQGDRATYHYIDNLARAIRYTGRILIDLIPKIYDTARVVRIIGDDGSEDFASIDPTQDQAVREEPNGDDVKLIYNPSVGRYDVTIEVGPNYETRRQEAYNALTQIMAQDKDLMKVAGDLMFKSADFPLAEEIAERLHRTIDPSILGEAPPPQVKEMQGQMQHMGQMIEQLSGQLQAERADREQQEINIKSFDAETKRMVATAGNMDPADIAAIAAAIAHQAIMNPNPEQQQQPQQQQPQAQPQQQPASPQPQQPQEAPPPPAPEPAPPPQPEPQPDYIPALTEAVQQMTAAAKEMSRSKKRTIHRGADGKTTHMTEE